jgi:hypothetical protein
MKVAEMLAMLGVLSLATCAMAAEGDKKPAHPAGLRGKVVKVDGANVVIMTRARDAKEGKEVTVATDDKTAVTIDGKDAKVADLKAGMYVSITPETGTATKIAAMTKLPDRKPGGGHKPGGHDKPADKPK